MNYTRLTSVSTDQNIRSIPPPNEQIKEKIELSNFAAETSQGTTSPDTVQCGACRVSYPLGEIVRFIEHKVNHCRITLQGCHSPPATAAPEDSDPEDALALKTVDQDSKLNSVPSISAPINKRGGGRLESPPTPQGSGPDAGSPIELKASASSTPKRRTEASNEDKEDLPKKQKTESVDADTNTVNSGECVIWLYSCLWRLLRGKLVAAQSENERRWRGSWQVEDISSRFAKMIFN